MTAHRWIKRADTRVYLYVNDLRVGYVWQGPSGNWMRNAYGISEGPLHDTKAAAKRALLRAVLAPRTKERSPAAVWCERDGNGESHYCPNGADSAGYIQKSETVRGATFAFMTRHVAHFSSEDEAKRWVEWRSQVKS